MASLTLVVNVLMSEDFYTVEARLHCNLGD